MNAHDLWTRCVSRLATELSPEEMNTWINPLLPSDSESGMALLAPNSFVLSRVRDQYVGHIEDMVNHIAGTPVPIELRVGTVGTNDVEQEAAQSGVDPRGASNLDPIYQFDNFVQGKSNQMAFAAAQQVAENPGQSAYNPLLFYGGTGLGKTHLLHAVGNALKAGGARKVMYLHSEQFVSAMILALRYNTIDDFKQRYRTADALLIDDIQFLAGKERSQEEFFHTFNTLVESRQQVILTCDRFPKEVDGLKDRLKSRFGWGLPVAIEPPDFETRVAILISKAAESGFELTEEVASLIARNVRSNVRELEGALNTLHAKAHFSGADITADFAREALSDLLDVYQRQITIENIQKKVGDYYQLRLSDLLSKRRTRDIARARQMAMALAKELTDHSLPSIGQAFGGRDHTTVLHACRKIDELMKSDSRIKDDYEKLLRVLTH